RLTGPCRQPGWPGVERISLVPPPPSEIPLLRFRREFRHVALDLAVARQHPLKTCIERRGDVGPLLQRAQYEARGLDGRESVAARLLAQVPVARRLPRAEDHALAFQHPGIAPPQRLGLAPGAVEQHDAFDTLEDRP